MMDRQAGAVSSPPTASATFPARVEEVVRLGLARGDWPFRARAEELRVLTAAVLKDLDDTGGSGPYGAVVVAPAGVGKTRLLREVAREAESRGVPASLAIATSAARGTPYGALAHLLPEAPAEHTDISSWYRSVAGVLHPRGAPVPLLAVDDAHLLDEHSAALVLHLALTGAGRVLVTLRRGEPVPEPITTLWKNELALRVDLQAFSSAEIGSIVAGGLGGEVAAHTRVRLAEASDGNVLFARELVLAAVDAGNLAELDGVWRWDGEVALAPRLVDAVGARLGHLDDEERSALALMALGEPLPLSVASGLTGPRMLARLETAGLVAVDSSTASEQTCRLAHPLYGDVVLAGLGSLDQSRLTLRLADTLEAAGRDGPDDALRIATWRLDHGGPVTTDQLATAATLANRMFDPALAERLARAALDRTGSPRAAVELAGSYVARNRFDEAESVLAAAEHDVLAREGDADLHQRYLELRHGALYMGLRHREEMLAMLDRFDAAHGAGSHEDRARSLSMAYRARVLWDDGRLDAVLEVVGPALEATDAFPLARLLTLEVAADALAHQGRTTAARELHGRMRELIATGAPEVRHAALQATLQEVLCLVIEGRLDEALDIAEPIRTALAGESDPLLRGVGAMVVGGIQLQRGRPESARRLLLDAVEGFGQRDSGQAGAWAFAMLAEASALLGQLPEARAALARSAELETGPTAPRMLVDRTLARAFLQAGEGDVTGAFRTTLAGAEQLGELAMPRAMLLHAAAMLGAPPGPTLADLRRTTERAECAFPGLLVEHVEALAADDGDRLAEVAARLEQGGALLLTAEAASQAARAYAHAGRAADHHRLATRSRSLAARCEGASTPALALDEVAPARLSRRESEIARLAAEGLTNTEIAGRMVVSVRTVESHLYRAFGKLGVESRKQLSEAMSMAGRQIQ